MAGMICTVKGCGHSTNDATVPQCAMTGCPGRETFVRIRPNLTATHQLANLKAALSRCDKCDNGIEPKWNFCAWCGWQLVEDSEP